jgi:hypothetical protein
MAVKWFVIGRPGSGKTSAVRYIAGLIRDKKWSVHSINDYEILKDMFHADDKHIKFLPTNHNGFDVLDFSVLDVALQEIEKQVQTLLFPEDLISIEFARNDYKYAMERFDHNFLRNAYFLFINADIDVCLERIHKRVVHPETADDHPSLSDENFRNHYRQDNMLYITSEFKSRYSLQDRQVMIIENVGSLEEFRIKLEEYTQILLQELNDLVSIH